MPLRPICAARRPTYPPQGSRLSRSLRRLVIAVAVPLLSAGLGCAATPPGVMVAPTVPDEVLAVQPITDEEEPTEVVEEWVQVPVRILFDPGSADLGDVGQAMLREFQATLSHRTDVLRIRATGFTFREDDREESLALARVQVVIDFMVTGLGMDREMFEPVARRGEPLMGDFAPSDYPSHRRVEFSLLVRRAR